MNRFCRSVVTGCLGLSPLACAAPAGQAPAPSGPATYTLVATRVFSNCTTRSCHGPEGRKGGLELTPAVAYDQLVGAAANHPAAAARGRLRVVAGNPAASWLLEKLEGPATGEGGVMPPRGDRLPEAERALVRAWIAAGCPR